MDRGFGKGLLWGLVVGGTAGILAGMLLAPKSGKDVRNDIANKLNEWFDSDTEPSNRDENDWLINEGRQKGEALVADAKEKAELLLADAEKLLFEIRNQSEHSMATGQA
ncbi:MAG: YtxH domain-containing protein [Bacteroidetes bacterium]|nr:YtxH domain-containing protein [Bacteroidota bacterium]